MSDKELIRAEMNSGVDSNKLANATRMKEQKQRRLLELRQGLQLYKAANYEEALEKFESVLGSKPTPSFRNRWFPSFFSCLAGNQKSLQLQAVNTLVGCLSLTHAQAHGIRCFVVSQGDTSNYEAHANNNHDASQLLPKSGESATFSILTCEHMECFNSFN
ncbi:hypothetical protein ACFE04_004780 [Oxalis oulophora]